MSKRYIESINNVQYNFEKYIIHDMNIIGNCSECLIFTHRLAYDNENIYIPVNNADFVTSFHWESENIEVVKLPKVDANYYRLISIDEILRYIGIWENKCENESYHHCSYI